MTRDAKRRAVEVKRGLKHTPLEFILLILHWLVFKITAGVQTQWWTRGGGKIIIAVVIQTRLWSVLD
jgi:hypothetical protein